MQWVEKYRPITLNNITSQNNIIQSLKAGIKNKNIPHLIFYGSAGCGKTSTILALTYELFGKNNIYNHIIELNASDERGINIVREKIKLYAKQSVQLNDNIPPWKIIILDEADTMTSDSQFALRRIIEEYSNITRFCFICNYYNKIIDPIISRCSLFCFKPILNIDILNKLKDICLAENFDCSVILLNKIVKISRGDLRKAINYLQKCYNYYSHELNDYILEEISGILPDILFNELITYIFKKDIKSINKFIKKIYDNGYSIVNQILLFHDFIIQSSLTNLQKANILIKITDIDQHLIKGCDEYIQYTRLIYYIVYTI